MVLAPSPGATFPMTSSITKRRAILVCVNALITALACCGLCIGAVLAHAPTAVAPLIAACCVGMPVVAALQLPAALSVLRGGHQIDERRILAELRRGLDRLPEVDHPLGL